MYCTADDLVSVLRESDIAAASSDGDVGQADNEIVNGIIDAVNDQIDSHLRSRYQLPIPEGQVPPALRDVALILAKYRLWIRIYEDPPQGLKDDRDLALSYLDKVQRGVVVLALPGVAGQRGPKSIKVSAPARVFTDDYLRRMP
jgi:phage gp36-like protein